MMTRPVVIIGGGIAGLGAAIGLARRGAPVTVIERDPPPPAGVVDPFLQWPRRSVPQFRLPHGFSARTRNVLAAYAPEVLDQLRADGIGEINLFTRLVDDELLRAGDDEFTNVWARRAAFEFALRRSAEATAGIELRCPAIASGLRIEHPVGGGVPRVTGVRLAGGGVLDADVVLDCGGQRTAVPRWLAAAGVRVPTEVQDCQTVYFSRYFRFTDACELPRTSIATLRGELGSVAFVGFPGDHDTFAVGFECHPDDEDMRLLRHPAVWQAAAASIPAVAPWVDGGDATPIDGVRVMGGNRNTRRHYVVDGRPVVLGLLPVGDALCTTNPAYGWGSAMALTYAFAAAAAVADGGELAGVGLAYDAAVSTEADAVYRESAAMDRARIYRITGTPVPEHDRVEMERQHVIAAGLAGGVLTDVEFGRAFCRRVNLVGNAKEVLDNDELLAGAVRAAERVAAEQSGSAAPTGDQVGYADLRATVRTAAEHHAKQAQPA